MSTQARVFSEEIRDLNLSTPEDKIKAQQIFGQLKKEMDRFYQQYLTVSKETINANEKIHKKANKTEVEKMSLLKPPTIELNQLKCKEITLPELDQANEISRDKATQATQIVHEIILRPPFTKWLKIKAR